MVFIKNKKGLFLRFIFDKGVAMLRNLTVLAMVAFAGGEASAAEYKVNVLQDFGGQAAVVWSSSGSDVDLADILGGNWSYTAAVAISDRGDFDGYGNYEGTYESVVRTPTPPEPPTSIMMLAGFAGLGLLGYRRKNAARTTDTND